MNVPSATKSPSSIAYDYQTIKITQSRIDKGLVAIPVGLTRFFPDHNTTIYLYLGYSSEYLPKRYSSVSSKTGEARIGGMSSWFKEAGVQNNDEIVFQVVDREKRHFRLIPEKLFLAKTAEIQSSLDTSQNEPEALSSIKRLADLTLVDNRAVILNEYFRLAKSEINQRKSVLRRSHPGKESAPSHIRILLGNVYQGRCQVCSFCFLKKDRQPYFEIHHINPHRGNDFRNLVLVCANCHRQFEFAHVRKHFNDEGWLTAFNFNGNLYSLNQRSLEKGSGSAFKEIYY